MVNFRFARSSAGSSADRSSSSVLSPESDGERLAAVVGSRRNAGGGGVAVPNEEIPPAGAGASGGGATVSSSLLPVGHHNSSSTSIGGSANEATTLATVAASVAAASARASSSLFASASAAATSSSASSSGRSAANNTGGAVGLRGAGPDIQNSRQRRLGPGGARKAKRKVLKILDSPRRVIMSRRQQAMQRGGQHGENMPVSSGNIMNGTNGGRGGDSTVPGMPHVAAPADPSPPIISTVVGNGRQVSPHYSHFRMDRGASGGGVIIGARSILKASYQQRQDGSGGVSVIDLPCSGGFGPFPSQETTAPPPPSNESGGVVQAPQVFAQATDVLSWLHDEAPHDILPRVLSFAGSRKIDLLSRTCKSWRSLALSEPVWRTACEDTGKWREGIDGPVSRTWLQHYVDNPLVPTDYDTIESALRRGPTYTTDEHNARPTVPEHRRSVRVLLRPARYVIREALIVHAVGGAEVTIETVEPPVRPTFHGEGTGEDGAAAGAEAASSLASSGRRKLMSTASLRDMLTCRYSSAEATDGGAAAPEDVVMEDAASTPRAPSLLLNHLHPSDFDRYARTGHTFDRSSSHGTVGGGSPSLSACAKPPPRRATLVLKTRRPNEPIVRVRQGTVRLNKIDLVHNASGTDIWNGNAAVQVQPPFDENENPLRAVPPSIPPTAVVDSCDIVSYSGRGIVTIDGGFATVRDCYIHNCAATGIYIGGPGSVATVDRTDVLENGNGNERSRRGIARGHSGIYLEQGMATLRDCNISNNSLTGISAISADNATLNIEDSDLVSNGSIQLEMPPAGSASRRRSVARNNRVSTAGLGRTRSGLVPAPPEPELETDRSGGNSSGTPSYSPPRLDRPQSPLADASPPVLFG